MPSFNIAEAKRTPQIVIRDGKGDVVTVVTPRDLQVGFEGSPGALILKGALDINAFVLQISSPVDASNVRVSNDKIAYFILNDSGVPVTVKLPTPPANPGQTHIIKDYRGTASNTTPITITTDDGSTIDGQTAQNIVIAYGAIMFVWTGQGWVSLALGASGAGGGAPNNARYVVWGAEIGLSNSRVLSVTSGHLTLDTTAPNANLGLANTGTPGTYTFPSEITVDSQGRVTSITSTTGSGGNADPGAQYIVMALTASLTNERVATQGLGIRITDGGANGPATWAINNSVVATISGSTFTGATLHTAGLSGSLTRLTDGRSYIVGGTGITVTSASNGQITIVGAAASSSVDAPINATYLVLTADGTLTAERVFAPINGIKFTDGGAGGTYNIFIDDRIVATISGSTFSGVTNHTAGLSGSLTRLTNGQSYLVAGSNIVITSASNGQIEISSTATGSFSGSGISGINVSGSGTPASGNPYANLNFTGAGVSVSPAGNGVIDIIIPGVSGSASAGGADVSASYIVLTTTASLPNERAIRAGTGIHISDGGPNGNLTISCTVSGSGSSSTGGGDPNASYLVIGLTSSLPNARFISPGTGISISDGGPGGSLVITATGGSSGGVSGSCTIPYHDLTYNPVALWQLSGNLNDSSGFGHTQAVGTGLARYSVMGPGMLGFYFDGSTALVPTSSVTSRLTLTGAMTCEFIGHFMPTIGSNIQTLVGIAGLTGDENGNENYLFRIGSLDLHRLSYFSEYDIGVNQQYDTTNAFIPTKLTHYAVTRDVSTGSNFSGTVRFYIDGELLETATVLRLPNTGTTGTSSCRVCIGGTPGGSFSSFDLILQKGYMSSVKIIDRALTDAEVRAEYQRTVGAFYACGGGSCDCSGSGCGVSSSYAEFKLSRSLDTSVHWTFDTNTLVTGSTNKYLNSGISSSLRLTLTATNTTGIFPGAQGIFDQAVFLTGTALVAPESLAQGTNGTITVSMWVKPNTKDKGYRRLIAKTLASGSWVFPFASVAIYQPTDDNTKVEYSIAYPGSNRQTIVSPPWTLQDNQWNHVALVYDKSRLWGYCNGVEVAIASLNNTIDWGTTPGGWSIGGNEINNSEYYSGSIDDVRIINNPLAADDIRKAYETGIFRYYVSGALGLVSSVGCSGSGAGGGGGSGDTSASYWVMSASANLSNERVVLAGAGIAFVEDIVSGTVTISSTVSGSSGGADVSASYVVLGLTSSLANERVLTVGAGLTLTDNGPNSTVVIAAATGSTRLDTDSSDIIIWRLTELTGSRLVNFGTSGSSADLTGSSQLVYGRAGVYDSAIDFRGYNTPTFASGALGVKPKDYDFTVSSWIYPYQFLTGVAVFKNYTTGTYVQQSPIILGVTGAFGQPFVQLRTTNAATNLLVVDESRSLNVYNWNHFGFSLSGSGTSAVARFYVNGDFVKSMTVSGSIDYDGNGWWGVGGVPPTGAESGDYKLNEIRITNVVRNDQWWRDIYLRGLRGTAFSISNSNSGGGPGQAYVTGTWRDAVNAFITTGSVSIDSQNRTAAQIGSDVFFFVSGSMNQTGSGAKNALFGGDTYFSGAVMYLGGMVYNTVTVTGSYFVGRNDYLVGVQQPNGSSSTIFTPTGTIRQGRAYKIADVAGNASSGTITISGSAGSLILGQSTYQLSINWASVDLIRFGNNWIIG